IPDRNCLARRAIRPRGNPEGRRCSRRDTEGPMIRDEVTYGPLEVCMIEIGDADLAHTTRESHANAELAVRPGACPVADGGGDNARHYWAHPARSASTAHSTDFDVVDPTACCAQAWQSDAARGQAACHLREGVRHLKCLFPRALRGAPMRTGSGLDL